MKRALLALMCLAVDVTASRAHFVFIVPEASGAGAKVIFSDSLEPDENVPIAKIANLKLFVRDASGKSSPLDWKKGDFALSTTIPGDAQLVGGSVTYGVFQRGDAKPGLLIYHPKLIVGALAAAKAWDKLPLEIVPTGAGQFVFLNSGKPVADAEVNVMLPGDQREKLQTDAKGEFKLATTPAGTYAIYARYVEPKAGEHDGKKYEQLTQYATLVYRSGTQASAAPAAKAVADKGEVQADPEATKLLADARAARALWQHFPGFAADVEVNWDGKVARGKVNVDATGKVRRRRA